jgi:hypothetical protein
MMKGFRPILFVITLIVTTTLTFGSFVAAWGRDEGTLNEDKLMWALLADSFDFFRLPTHGLFWDTITKTGGGLYLLGLFVNIIFWSLIMERATYWTGKLLERNLGAGNER